MKILIVDDSSLTIRYLLNFISNISNHTYVFSEARNYDSAMLFLDEKFDLVLCDNYLDNGKFGVDFLNDYQLRNSGALCFLYSAEPEKVNSNFAKKIKCYSIDELENELVFSLENINQSIRHSEAIAMQQVANYNGFSKELCDTLHKENTKDHDRIEARQDAMVTTIKEVRDDLKIAMKEFGEKFDASNNQGRNSFWAIVVFGGGVLIMPIVIKLIF